MKKKTVITPEGNIQELIKEECKLEYRNSLLKVKKYIVIEVEFISKKENKMKIQKNNDRQYKDEI